MSIKVGDLVQVVKTGGCGCGPSTTVGLIFQVSRIRMSTGLHCSACGKQKPDCLIAEGGDMSVYGVWRLKRIPPLSELEGVKTQEPLKEGVH